jgi:hypothetical protein
MKETYFRVINRLVRNKDSNIFQVILFKKMEELNNKCFLKNKNNLKIFEK